MINVFLFYLSSIGACLMCSGKVVFLIIAFFVIYMVLKGTLMIYNYPM